MRVTTNLLPCSPSTTACKHGWRACVPTKPRVVTGRPNLWLPRAAQANPAPAVPAVAPAPSSPGMPPPPAEPKSLADQLLEAEAELEGLFGEDCLPPTAKQVNTLRERIAHLRALLTGKVSSTMPPGASQALTAAGMASVRQDEQVKHTITQGDKTGILAHQYFDDNELEYALTVEQKWEADWLSAENAKLRRKAFDLLKRQEQLEELLESHINGLRKQRKASPAPQQAVGAHKAAPLEAIPGVDTGLAVAPLELPPVAPAPAAQPTPKVEATPVVATGQVAVDAVVNVTS